MSAATTDSKTSLDNNQRDWLKRMAGALDVRVSDAPGSVPTTEAKASTPGSVAPTNAEPTAATTATPAPTGAAPTGGSNPPPPAPDDDPKAAEYKKEILKVASKGPAVEYLQKKLNATGAKLEVDGKFGPATQAAVKAFQKSKGLTDDGVVGPKTWAALDEATPKPDPPKPVDTKPRKAVVIVTNAATNDAVDKAVVKIGEQSEPTGNTGQATLSLPPGSYPYGVTADGYEQAIGTFEVTDKESSELRVELKGGEKQTVQFSVQVLRDNPKGGNPIPIPGAIFQIQDKSQPTDQSGFARIELPGGNYPFRVTAKKFQNCDGLMKAGNEKQVTQTVLLGQGAVLLIDTKSTDGKPVNDVTIQIDDEESDSTGKGSSKLFIHSVSPGKHTYHATAEGFEKADAEFQMKEDDTPLEIILTPSQAPGPAVKTGQLTVQVRWAGQSAPISNAILTVEPPPLPPSATFEMTGDDGLANFEKLGVGKCTISAEMLGATATKEVTISEDTVELAEIEIPRPATGKLSVKVVWASGPPVKNAMVTLDPPPVPPATLFELAGDDGMANFDEVVVGKCTVTAKQFGSVGKATVNISEDVIELATISLPLPAATTGKLTVTVTKNGTPVVGQKVTVNSDDRQAKDLKQESVTKDGGVATFTLPPGDYLVSTSVAPFGISTSVKPGKTQNVTFDGNKPNEVVVDVVPWNTYFNQQFSYCEKQWFFLNIPRTIPIPGLAPTGNATDNILECMSRTVTVQVEAEDKATGRPAQAGRTRTELNAWYQKNKSKFEPYQ